MAEAASVALPTVADALRKAARQLAPATDTARLDAELLMAHALGVSRSDLLLRHMRAPVPAAFAALLERRERHEPVAYIIGEQEFHGLSLHVAPGVLIPRADTETTLTAGLAAVPGATRVLDCGTGSGALLLAALAELPTAKGIGIDRSPEALDIAQANANRLGLAERADLRCRDWDKADWAADLGHFDLVFANPPYVEEAAQLAPDVRDFEPGGALFAGAEGLDAYRVLVPQLRGLLAPGGVAVLEIGAAQAATVREIAAGAGFAVSLHHDLGGRPRALVLH